MLEDSDYNENETLNSEIARRLLQLGCDGRRQRLQRQVSLIRRASTSPFIDQCTMVSEDFSVHWGRSFVIVAHRRRSPGTCRSMWMPIVILLVVTEAGEHVPFHRIQRMFMIVALAGAKRGRHAHRLCSQFMLCVKGSAVDVVCDDGMDRKTFSLDHPELALFVPPGLWIEIDARQNAESVLIVLCDRLYEEHDYIRNYVPVISKTLRA
jgi:WxcM-like, C-terminal